MDLVLKDKRFAKVQSEKKFRPLGKKQRKVNIDKRFESVFKDEKFVSRCTIDPRGRPKSFGTKESYLKFYDLKGSDESESENSESEEDKDKDDDKDDDEDDEEDEKDDDDDSNDDVMSREEVQTDDGEDSDSDEDPLEQQKKLKSVAKVKEDEETGSVEENIAPVRLNPMIKKKLKDLNVDYARGEANLYSDSSSGESSSEDEDTEETTYLETLNKWGEMDHDAARTEEVTSRLAVCNMDWDNVNADDIFLALSSFCPAGGCVKSVNVYVSEFGKTRIEEEDKMGPAELQRLTEENKKLEEVYENIIDSSRRAEIDEELAIQRVREHQLNRLKYYYAVTQFDSDNTANSVYTECDGKEFESSATMFDLRFIPEDMGFDDQPVSSCTCLPERTHYRPKTFSNSALTSKKVKLTWDEQDAERGEQMKKAYERIDNNDEDFSFAKGLIASSSSEESEEESEEEDDDDDDDDDEEDEEEQETETKKKEKTRKKKKLSKKSSKGRKKDVAEDGGDDVELGSDDENSSDQDSDNETDIEKYRALIFGLDKDKKQGGKKQTGNLEITWQEEEKDDEQEQSDKQNEEEELTPFQKILKKKKEKRDKKKQERMKKYEGSDAEESEGGDNIPDDVDLDDPFFAEEYDMKKAVKPKKKRTQKRKHDDEVNDEDKDDLALLVLDEEDDNNHFNYRSIVEEETKGKSKKKKWKNIKKAALDTTVQDDFDLNVNDDRFAAIYSRPEFNIDPSAQNFKKTKAMDTLIGEKQKRITSGTNQPKSVKKPDVKDSKKSKLDPELTASLKAVKNKWAKNSKKKKI